MQTSVNLADVFGYSIDCATSIQNRFYDLHLVQISDVFSYMAINRFYFVYIVLFSHF